MPEHGHSEPDSRPHSPAASHSSGDLSSSAFIELTGPNGDSLPSNTSVSYDSIQKLVDGFKRLGFNAYNRIDYGANSLQDLVRMIERAPLAPKDVLATSSLQSSKISALMWTSPGNDPWVFAIRLEQQDGFIRDAITATDLIRDFLRFNRDSTDLSLVRLIILPSSEYDQIVSNGVIGDATKRHEFVHHYKQDAVGAEIRDRLLAQGVESRASDIHVEPTLLGDRVQYRVRFRIDGGLVPDERLLTEEQGAALVSAIKVKAQMDIADRLRPGQGQIEFDSEDFKRHPYLRGYNCRVSSVPTKLGESAVVRILKTPQLDALHLDKLNLPADIEQRTRELLDAPQGIILMTGPTGSGKTTTLYSMLNYLNRPDLKIFTIEDPVEMTLGGLTQSEVNLHQDRDFMTLLKTALRQDPDVILIGEIRDAETAEIAIQASNTGHLVLATLHTNSAIGTLSRIRELGIESSRIAENLLGVYAQRLVRKCCPSCVERYDARDELNKLLKFTDTSAFTEKIEMIRPKASRNKNCNDCNGKGYVGRQVVADLWDIGDVEREMITNGEVSEKKFRDKALERSYRPLPIRGIQAALERKTSLEEVLNNVTSIDRLRELRGSVKLYVDYFIRNRSKR